MKNKLKIMGMIILLIITSTITTFAGTENTIMLEIADNKTEVKAGETFTVTLNASAANGISGIAGIVYNYDTEKLEVTQESVGQNFMSFEENGLALMYSGSTVVTEAEIYTITFTVKDGVEQSSTTVSFDEAILIDVQSNEYTVPEQDITIDIVEDTTEGDGTEGDGAEGDGTEGDGAEGDGTEGDGAEGDGTEGDGAEGDGTEGDGAEGDGAEGDGTEGDGTEGDGAEGDGAEGDGAEGDGAEGDGAEGDGAEGDGAEGDGAEDDNKTADKDYPNAGLNTMLIIGMVAIVIVALVIYRKNQKYKDIK